TGAKAPAALRALHWSCNGSDRDQRRNLLSTNPRLRQTCLPLREAPPPRHQSSHLRESAPERRCKYPFSYSNQMVAALPTVIEGSVAVRSVCWTSSSFLDFSWWSRSISR